MAGDWLKIEKDTPEKPEVIALASLLKISTDDAFGKCFRFWRWADSHTLDGFARTVSGTWLDNFIGLPGFSDRLVEVGWLRVRHDGLEIPNFHRHCGDTAKTRALDAKRTKVSRAKDTDCENVRVPYGQNADQRREEKRRCKNKSPPSPSCEEAARRVVAHYQKIVVPAQTTSRGVKNVSALLKHGKTEEQLSRCADGYLDWCQRNGKEPAFRKAVGNFYGQDATYEDFLEWQPEKKPEELTPAEREEMARRKTEEFQQRGRYLPDGQNQS